MRIELQRINNKFHFEASNTSGNTVQIDGNPDYGGEGKGARPMELLLMGLAGCSGIDIGLILGKQQLTLDDFRAEVEGEREEEVPGLFKWIKVTFHLSGDLNPAKAKRAVDLTMSKYCTVAKTLEQAAPIHYEIYLNNTLLE